MVNSQYRSKDLELLQGFQASNQTISEAFAAKDSELQACYAKGNDTQVEVQKLIHHNFNASVSSDEKLQFTIASLESITQYNKNYGSSKADHSWQDWILDNAIPFTLAIGFSFLGGFVAGRWMQPTPALKPTIVNQDVHTTQGAMTLVPTSPNDVSYESGSELPTTPPMTPVISDSAAALASFNDYDTPYIGGSSGAAVAVVPKTPFRKQELKELAEKVKTITKKRSQDSDGTPSKNNMEKAIDNFVGKFTNKKGYTNGQRKVLEETLKKYFKATFPEGTTKALYELMDKLFHSDNTLSISKTDELTDQFSEHFERFKDHTSATDNKEAARVFGLSLEATAEILKAKDVDTGYMVYLAKVIIAGFVVANVPGARADVKYNETAYALDDNVDDESEAAAEEVAAISEPSFAEKFESKLPEYGEIIGVNFVSGALKYVNYVSAVCAMEMLMPGVLGIVPTVSLAHFISEMTNNEMDCFATMFDNSANGLSGEEGFAS